MQARVDVQGVEAVLVAMSKLGAGLQRKYLRAAVTKVTRPYVQDVKAITPKGPTGNLRRSVGVIAENKSRGRTQMAVLGYRRGDKAGSNGSRSGYHAWWVENGTLDRYPKIGVALKIPAKNFRKRLAAGVTVRGDSLFVDSVRGSPGTGKFKAWADTTLPRIRAALEAELGNALRKATAEAARREAKGKS